MVIVDTIGVRDQVGRARRSSARHHWSTSITAPTSARPTRRETPRSGPRPSEAAVTVPLGCGCFGVEDGVAQASLGADVIVIGHPLISGPDPLGALKEICEKVRAAYKPRPHLQVSYAEPTLGGSRRVSFTGETTISNTCPAS